MTKIGYAASIVSRCACELRDMERAGSCDVRSLMSSISSGATPTKSAVAARPPLVQQMDGSFDFPT